LNGLQQRYASIGEFISQYVNNPIRSQLVWFTTPNVELALQQHRFLAAQLPAYSFRSITSLDNAEFWTSQEVWDSALLGIHGIISTPQILLDAMRHGFVSMRNISLLVVDEAHHGIKKHSTNLIMQEFFHPLREQDPKNVPHILGLSAYVLVARLCFESF
jgi:ERCC4-related helicase